MIRCKLKSITDDELRAIYAELPLDELRVIAEMHVWFKENVPRSFVQAYQQNKRVARALLERQEGKPDAQSGE